MESKISFEKLCEKLEQLIKLEEQALKDDDPNGTCAASHRGEIRAYKRVLGLISVGEGWYSSDKPSN